MALRPGRPLLAVPGGITQENYLRGVQETGSDGSVTFTSIFPAAYPTVAARPFRGLPEPGRGHHGQRQAADLPAGVPEDAAGKQVYATDGYSQSVQNMAQSSLETDMVFSDGYSLGSWPR